jgi:hypothetical protein
MGERDRAEAEGVLTRAKLTSAERVLTDVKAERGTILYYFIWLPFAAVLLLFYA